MSVCAKFFLVKLKPVFIATQENSLLQNSFTQYLNLLSTCYWEDRHPNICYCDVQQDCLATAPEKVYSSIIVPIFIHCETLKLDNLDIERVRDCIILILFSASCDLPLILDRNSFALSSDRITNCIIKILFSTSIILQFQTSR